MSTRDPERMDSRLRGRPERPRFVPTASPAPVEDAGLFDFYGDAMFGFDNYDGTEYDDANATGDEASNTGRPTFVFQNQQRSGSGGYCRICDGQDATNCAAQSAGELCTT